MPYLKTTATATSTNYPYGRLRCTATWSIEFKAGKGFRLVFQTINPKTNRLNAPKKGTYKLIEVLHQDENGFVTCQSFNLNGVPELNNGLKFVAENFDLFTDEQIKEIYAFAAGMLKASWGAIIAYCGADKDAAKELFAPHMTLAVRGFKEGGNNFKSLIVDNEKYEGLKVPDFNPFKR